MDTDEGGTREVIDEPARRASTGKAAASKTHNSLGKPTVLILDEPVRAELFEMWLESGCQIRTANTKSSVTEQFDQSITVALVRNEARKELKSTVERQIARRSPFCRTVITTNEHVEILFPGIEYDVCLSEPTTKRSVRETVGRLARRAQYQATLRRYYDFSLRAASLEVSQGRETSDDEDKRETLVATADRLKDRLEALRSTFDADDLAAVKQSLKHESDFGREATRRNRQKGEKHRPDVCVGCGLEWGVEHGGGLDEGYRRLGAFAWKCTDCGTVQNIPDPSHRRLAHR